ncbi:hypothetical protein RRG08_002715 [Elysia crispata]|uniref:Uncharacterized protein n=1 Tax=Elysia crispata TaxID=231223 RepID=A0AAE0XU72_9GAST|nr:hypothetical protein RRG08_002715 [Elysia crispata]
MSSYHIVLHYAGQIIVMSSYHIVLHYAGAEHSHDILPHSPTLRRGRARQGIVMSSCHIDLSTCKPCESLNHIVLGTERTCESLNHIVVSTDRGCKSLNHIVLNIVRACESLTLIAWHCVCKRLIVQHYKS